MCIRDRIVRRYSDILAGAAPLFRFMQENQAAVRELRIGETFKERMQGLREIVVDPDAELVDQVRYVSAIFTLHAGMFLLQDLAGDDEDKRRAVLEVAADLVNQAHRGTPKP